MVKLHSKAAANEEDTERVRSASNAEFAAKTIVDVSAENAKEWYGQKMGLSTVFAIAESAGMLHIVGAVHG